MKTQSTEWISVKEKLPEEGKYVLARHNRGTWHDSTDHQNVNCVVVKLRKGLSIEDRDKMKKGLIPTTYQEYSTNYGTQSSPRWNVYSSDDEHDNNKVSYGWHEFGPDHFFGQSITHWMSIPPFEISEEKSIIQKLMENPEYKRMRETIEKEESDINAH